MADERAIITDVNASTLAYFKKYWIFCVLAIIILGSSLWIALTSQSEFLLFYSLLIFFVCFFVVQFIRAKIQEEFMEEFARVNGFQFSKNGDVTKYKGELFNNGYSREVTNVVSGSYGNVPFNVFDYSFTVGSGKSSHTFNFTIAELIYNGAKFPHILVNHRALVTLNPQISPGNDLAPLTLEGNFNTYFNVYVTKGREVEALEMFTPDVMSDLIIYRDHFDMELWEDRLYTYHDKTIRTSEELVGIISLLKVLSVFAAQAKTI